MSKTYTITFDEKKKRYRLTPETGRVILVRADHKKFEWLQNQEKGKIVKISDSGRWTSSKDYDGLYEAVKSLSQEKIIDNKVTKAKSAKNKGDIKKSESGFIDVIRCDEIEYLVWKWQPSGEEKSKKKAKTISYGSCLRVKDGELAIFVYKQKNGENQDVIIGPHDQTIKTENFPILKSSMLELLLVENLLFKQKSILLAYQITFKFVLKFHILMYLITACPHYLYHWQ